MGSEYCPRANSDTPKDPLLWWTAGLLLSLPLFLAILCLSLSLSLSFLLFVTHFPSLCLSTCMRDWPVLLSVWTFLSDIWGRHKAEEVPNDALGLTLISLATRICLLSVPLCGLFTAEAPLEKAGKLFPLLTYTKLNKNDCGGMHVQSENKSTVSLSKTVGVETAARIKRVPLSCLLIGWWMKPYKTYKLSTLVKFPFTTLP